MHRTRVKRSLLILAVLAAAWLALLVRISEAMVSPPRPRVSASSRPVVGLVLSQRPQGPCAEAVVPPAREAGLAPGDCVRRMEDHPVDSLEVFRRSLDGFSGGDWIRVLAERGGEDPVSVVADVRLESRPVSPADWDLPYETLQWHNPSGLRLEGWWIPPPRGGAAPALVATHGNGSDRRRWLPWARAFHREGFGLLLFDFAGRGDSDGAVITLGWHEAADLRSALDLVASREDVDPRRLGVVGHSMGAAAALLEAAGDPRVGVLVCRGAYADLESVVAETLRGHHLPPALFLRPAMALAGWRAGFDPWAVRPREAAARVRAPVLLVHGAEDRLVPPAHARRLAEACPRATTLIVEEVGHNGPLPEPARRRVLEFVVRHLQGRQVSGTGPSRSVAFPP